MVFCNFLFVWRVVLVFVLVFCFSLVFEVVMVWVSFGFRFVLLSPVVGMLCSSGFFML